MEPETKQKIEETVIDILKDADMQEMTEFKVRNLASEKLGINLSAPEYKRVVRGIVESFISKKQEEAGGAEEAEEVDEGEDKQPGGGSKEYDDEGDLIICRLSNKRRVTIQEFRGKTLVSIREYFEKNGKQLPTSKGISLTTEQWRAFSKAVPAIEEAIEKLK